MLQFVAVEALESADVLRHHQLEVVCCRCCRQFESVAAGCSEGESGG